MPGEPHGQRSLAGYSLWGHRGIGHTERLNEWASPESTIEQLGAAKRQALATQSCRQQSPCPRTPSLSRSLISVSDQNTHAVPLLVVIWDLHPWGRRAGQSRLPAHEHSSLEEVSVIHVSAPGGEAAQCVPSRASWFTAGSPQTYMVAGRCCPGARPGQSGDDHPSGCI